MFKVLRNDLHHKRNVFIFIAIIMFVVMMIMPLRVVLGLCAVSAALLSVFMMTLNKDRDRMLGSLPVSCKDIIASVYIEGISIWLIIFLMSVIVDLIALFIWKTAPPNRALLYLFTADLDMTNMWVITFLVTAVGTALIVPLGIKGFMGASRACAAAAVALLLFMILISLPTPLSIIIFLMAQFGTPLFILIICAAAVGLLYASYKLSLKIYKGIER